MLFILNTLKSQWKPGPSTSDSYMTRRYDTRRVCQIRSQVEDFFWKKLHFFGKEIVMFVTQLSCFIFKYIRLYLDKLIKHMSFQEDCHG